MEQFVSKNKLAFFYIITFIISWSAWGIMYFVYDGISPSPIVYVFSSLGGLGPLLSLGILQKLTRQEVTVKQILSKIKIRQVKIQWVLPSVFAIPGITIIANLIAEQVQIIKSGPDKLGLAVLPVIVIQFIAGLVTSPLFEEPGWRGFALPRLQSKFGRTLGSLIVGVLWWLWHQPMNITFGLNPTLYSALSMIVFSFMIDSLFNLSNQNLFIPMLAHQSYSTVTTFLVQGEQNWIDLGGRIVFLVILRWIETSQTRQVREVSGNISS